jgi:hypothetical protein
MSTLNRNFAQLLMMGSWQEKANRPMEFELCSLPFRAFEFMYYMFCIISIYMFSYIRNLCSGGFAVFDCRHASVRCV